MIYSLMYILRQSPIRKSFRNSNENWDANCLVRVNQRHLQRTELVVSKRRDPLEEDRPREDKQILLNLYQWFDCMKDL